MKIVTCVTTNEQYVHSGNGLLWLRSKQNHSRTHSSVVIQTPPPSHNTLHCAAQCNRTYYVHVPFQGHYSAFTSLQSHMYTTMYNKCTFTVHAAVLPLLVGPLAQFIRSLSVHFNQSVEVVSGCDVSEEFVRSSIDRSSFVVRRSSFVVRRSSFVVRSLLFVAFLFLLDCGRQQRTRDTSRTAEEQRWSVRYRGDRLVWRRTVV